MPETQAILTALTEIKITVERQDMQFAALTAQYADANKHVQSKLEKFQAKLDDFAATLMGEGANTESALVVRVHRLEDSNARLEERAKAAEEWRTWATRLVIGAVLLGFLTVCGTALVAWVRTPVAPTVVAPMPHGNAAQTK